MNRYATRTVLIILAAIGVIAFVLMGISMWQFFVTGYFRFLIAGIIFGVGAMIDLIYYADLYRRNW